MNLTTTMKQHLTRDSIVDMLTRYELYYQISLGNFVLETLQDYDETLAKLKELNLQVPVDTALMNIVEIVKQHCLKDNFDEKLEYHLRSCSILHALKDFINTDKELLNSEDYKEDKTKAIVADTYFQETMKVQMESDYHFVYNHYDLMITDEVITKIHTNIG